MRASCRGMIPIASVFSVGIRNGRSCGERDWESTRSETNYTSHFSHSRSLLCLWNVICDANGHPPPKHVASSDECIAFFVVSPQPGMSTARQDGPHSKRAGSDNVQCCFAHIVTDKLRVNKKRFSLHYPQICKFGGTTDVHVPCRI